MVGFSFRRLGGVDGEDGGGFEEEEDTERLAIEVA
jgi:hypothetical protein